MNTFLYIVPTFIIGVLFLLYALWLTGIIYLCRKKRWVWSAVLSILFLAGPFYFIVFVVHPFTPVDRLNVIDSISAPEGTQIRLTQAFNGTPLECYTVALWVRPPGKSWGWFYVDHEDTWWRSGKIAMNGGNSSATIFRGKEKIGEIDLIHLKFKKTKWDDWRNVAWMDETWDCKEGGEYHEALNLAASREYLKIK